MAKGALIYFLGLPGKFAGFLVIWFAARYYGAQEIGVYLGAWALVQVSLKLATGGITEGLSVKIAQLISPEERNQFQTNKEVYQVLRTSLQSGLVVSLILTIVIWFLLDLILEYKIFEIESRIKDSLQILSLIIPIHHIIQVLVSATRGILKVQYDMWINSIVKQTLFLLIVVSTYFLYQFDYRLAWIQVAVYVLSLFIAIRGYAKWFDFKEFFYLKPWDWKFLRYCFPLSLNDLLSHLTQELDIIMLTILGLTSTIDLGFYGVAISIVFGIRMLRRNFMKVFVPLATNLISFGRWKDLNLNFNNTQRWILILALPLLSVFTLFAPTILDFYNIAYSKHYVAFIILAWGSFFNSYWGIYGALVFSTGRSHLVLMNSAINVALNALLNFFLIPKYGVLGAAISTSTAMFLSHIMMWWEIKIMMPQMSLTSDAWWYPVRYFVFPSIMVGLALMFLGFHPGIYFGCWVVMAMVVVKVIGVHPSDKNLLKSSKWLSKWVK